MSKPMSNEKRLEIYTRGLKYKTVDGFYRLTPKQRRRAQQKWNKNEHSKAL